MGYRMDLAVTRALARSAWAARSRSIASKLNSPSACGSSISRPRRRPPGEPRAYLIEAMDAGHDQPVHPGCGGVGGAATGAARVGW